MLRTFTSELIFVPKGARVVALNADVVQRLQARVDENNIKKSGPKTIEGVVAESLRVRIIDHELHGQHRRVLNRKKHIGGVDKLDPKDTQRVAAFEQVDGGTTVVVMPLIVAILEVHAAENGMDGGWLEEFATAVTFGWMLDAERVMIQAQCEVNAYHDGNGPTTAATMAAALDVPIVPPPPPPPPLNFDRARFPPFQEVAEHGRIELRVGGLEPNKVWLLLRQNQSAENGVYVVDKDGFLKRPDYELKSGFVTSIPRNHLHPFPLTWWK